MPSSFAYNVPPTAKVPHVHLFQRISEVTYKCVHVNCGAVSINPQRFDSAIASLTGEHVVVPTGMILVKG